MVKERDGFMGKIQFIPTEENIKHLEMLREAFKNDMKFTYALHASLMAKRMRSWGYKALPHLPKDKEVYDWMKDYPCGDFDELVFKTIKLHYPEIYKGLGYDVPGGYIKDFISENLYPFKMEL